MKKRLFFSVLFFGIGLTIASIALGVYTHYMAIQKQKIKVSDKKETLILGDSHPACGVIPNDDIVHLAKSGEAWYYQAIKGKSILEANTQIRTVLIEFNLGQLSPIMSQWILDDEHVERAIKSYCSIMDWNNWRFLLKNNPVQTIQSYWLSQKRILSEESFADDEEFMSIKEWGGFEENVKTCWDSLQVKPSKADQLELSPYSENIIALKEFVDWCQKRGIVVILIRCPQHRSSLNNQEMAVQQIRNEHFKEIPFFDFKDYPMADSLFLDREHLNANGARVFTPILLNRLTQWESH